MTDKSSPVRVSCSVASQTGGEVRLVIEAVNQSSEAVHLLDSDKLPYLLREGDGPITVLYGVNDPDPDMDYYGIEIPLTRELGPGETFSREFQLVPLRLRDHYQKSPKDTPVSGQVEVVCRLAYGATPIDKATRVRTSINALIAWQNWVEAPGLTVTVPGE